MFVKKQLKNHLILCSQYIFSFLTKCTSNVGIFRCHVIIWMSYENRLVFAYYNILRFYCFKKSLQRVPKTWQVLKSEKKFFWKMSKYRNAIFYDFKSRFLVIFFSNYLHRLVLEIPFPNHIFPKTSKYRIENLHFPSTGKYYPDVSGGIEESKGIRRVKRIFEYYLLKHCFCN